MRLALGSDNGTERFRGVQPGRHIGQGARDTQVVLWVRLGWIGKFDVCSALEPDVFMLVRAKGEWVRNDSRRFYGNGLEKGQDLVTIVCDGGQHLS